MKKVLLLAVMAMFFISCDTSNPPATYDYTFITTTTITSNPYSSEYPQVTKYVFEQKGITLSQAQEIAKKMNGTSTINTGKYLLTSTMFTTYILSFKYIPETGSLVVK
jgi:hypothetical protein